MSLKHLPMGRNKHPLGQPPLRVALGAVGDGSFTRALPNQTGLCGQSVDGAGSPARARAPGTLCGQRHGGSGSGPGWGEEGVRASDQPRVASSVGADRMRLEDEGTAPYSRLWPLP